jgi:hypothetical protein
MYTTAGQNNSHLLTDERIDETLNIGFVFTATIEGQPKTWNERFQELSDIQGRAWA